VAEQGTPMLVMELDMVVAYAGVSRDEYLSRMNTKASAVVSAIYDSFGIEGFEFKPFDTEESETILK